MNLYKNYYKILKIEKNASDSQIKKAYIELAKQYHPDKNDLPEAIIMFQEISEAYEILNSKNKSEYDKNSPHFKKANKLDIEIVVQVKAERQIIKYQAIRFCKKCDQTGFDVKSESHKCKKCDGRGYDDVIGEECLKCNSTGKIYDKLCNYCKGKKTVLVELETVINNTSSYKSFPKIVLPHLGHRDIKNNKTGSLIVYLTY